ncbi:MAG: hypothetical protein EBZ62_06515 [Sphingobacteriia bacterium]|nr:hypothetical protein [Sphingobacteriia bacterium]
MSKKTKSISIKNLTIVSLLGFILVATVFNICYLQGIQSEIHGLTISQEINSLRDSALRQSLSPISDKEFEDIKKEILRMSNQAPGK